MKTRSYSKKKLTKLNKSMKKSIPNPNKPKQTKQKMNLSSNPKQSRSNKDQLK